MNVNYRQLSTNVKKSLLFTIVYHIASEDPIANPGHASLLEKTPTNLLCSCRG